jgi:hypothetical protein
MPFSKKCDRRDIIISQLIPSIRIFINQTVSVTYRAQMSLNLFSVKIYYHQGTLLYIYIGSHTRNSMVCDHIVERKGFNRRSIGYQTGVISWIRIRGHRIAKKEKRKEKKRKGKERIRGHLTFFTLPTSLTSMMAPAPRQSSHLLI